MKKKVSFDELKAIEKHVIEEKTDKPVQKPKQKVTKSISIVTGQGQKQGQGG